jgi:hypothetical protein
MIFRSFLTIYLAYLILERKFMTWPLRKVSQFSTYTKLMLQKEQGILTLLLLDSEKARRLLSTILYSLAMRR